jgi:MFS family permease
VELADFFPDIEPLLLRHALRSHCRSPAISLGLKIIRATDDIEEMQESPVAAEPLRSSLPTAIREARQPLPLLALGVVLVEGFCSLALELIAIRRNSANLGDTVTLTGAVLATVLLAISIGYALGGWTATRIGRGVRGVRGLRVRASRNLLIAAALGGLAGLCHPTAIGIGRLLNLPTIGVALLAALLYAPGVALASATIPLLAEWYSRDRGSAAGEAGGLFLAVSTIGSVVGSLLTPTVLFELIGVRMTGVAVVALLGLAASLAHPWNEYQTDAPRGATWSTLWPLLLLAAGLWSSWFAQTSLPFARGARRLLQIDTAIQSASVIEFGEGETLQRQLISGAGGQSAVDGRGRPVFPYIKMILETIGDPPTAGGALEVLVIGAAGMVIPDYLVKRGWRVTAVDVDRHSLELARALLGRPMDPRVDFVVNDGRAYLQERLRKRVPPAEVVVLDAYTGSVAPEHLTTEEFARLLARSGRRVLINTFTDFELRSRHAARTATTLRAALPGLGVRAAGHGLVLGNFVYCAPDCAGFRPVAAAASGAQLYTDDRGGAAHDLARLAELRQRLTNETRLTDVVKQTR